jgi:hypothetical protein
MPARHLSFVVLAATATGIAAGGCGTSGSAAGTAGDAAAEGGGTSGASSGSTSGGSSGTSTSSSGGSSSSGSSASSGGSSGSSASSSGGPEAGTAHIKNVFVILMENENWSDIYQNAQAPYINGLLASAQASYATNYFDNPAANHPSEPNYVWLEAATDTFSDDDDTFSCDCDPSATNSTASTAHLATLLTAKGLSWREYAEGITSGTCPIASGAQYACKHVPFVFFQDIVGSPPSATSANCGPHMFAFSDLAGHLTSGNVAAYNFITPNLCDDMHGNTGCPATGEITQGDTWLQNNVPVIMSSDAYKNGGAIFITWDESEGGEFPIGMIVLSPFAKGHGYSNALKYYHSSTVRSVQEIFGLTPLLADAANQLDLSDLFSVFP